MIKKRTGLEESGAILMMGRFLENVSKLFSIFIKLLYFLIHFAGDRTSLAA